MRLIGLVLAFACSTAYADDTTSADQKFAEAMKLREQGNEPAACARFKESHALNPNAIGTILNVARCAEEAGNIGSAVRWFTEARERAREQTLAPQMEAAVEHLGKLVDHVPHLAIAFAVPPPADAKIIVDDQPVELAAAGDIIVDPHPVRVVISASGRVPFETTVKFDPKGDHEHKAIAVPALGYPVTVKNGRRTAGKVLVGSGGVVLAAGVVIGVLAKLSYDKAVKQCSDSGSVKICDPDPLSSGRSARTTGNIGTVVGVSGLVLASAGAVLWLMSPTREEHAIAIVPTVTPTEAGLAAVGRF